MQVVREKIVIIINQLDGDIEATIRKWMDGPSWFNIETVVSTNESVGDFMDCGFKIQKVEDIDIAEIDDFLIFCAEEDYIGFKAQLEKEYGIPKEKLIDHTAIFFLPSHGYMGSIKIDASVPTDCLIDANFLVQNNLIHYGNDLEWFYFEKEHRLINKWFHYFKIYEESFSKYRNKPIRMLEIGVSKGGSLQMWRDYFGEQATIIGVDIDKRCKVFEGDRIHVEIGSQEDRRFLKSLAKKWGPFDIILDDGGHTMRQQKVTFDELYSDVKWGGVYVCEDCHTSYWRGHFGGARRRGTYIEFMKDRIDDLNAQHIEAIFERIKTYKKHPEMLIGILLHMPRFLLRVLKLHNIAWKPYDKAAYKMSSIQFYDSVVVVEKEKIGKSFTLGLRR